MSLTQKLASIANGFLPAYDEKETVISSSGANQNLNAHTANVVHCTLDANCTFILSGTRVGRSSSITLLLKQDATGSRTIVFANTIKWSEGSVPVFSTAANAVDVVVLVYINGVWYGSLAGKGYA